MVKILNNTIVVIIYYLYKNTMVLNYKKRTLLNNKCMSLDPAAQQYGHINAMVMGLIPKKCVDQSKVWLEVVLDKSICKLYKCQGERKNDRIIKETCYMIELSIC